ncbi:MAG TPA: protein phosphatase 2C domain-containing protein [Blastocatellia bacterium]|nr:protein phosphatase 2C domain-containing protein [Blastocatellia bacterium]
MELKVGSVCDRGLNRKRPVNQDRFLALPERGLFAVFDGVGGQRAGEVASQTAAETIEEALAHTAATTSDQLIRRAIQFANRDIFEMAESDPAYKTMATTVALVYISGSRATVAHVGDSRVYRLEEGHFYRETIDHTDLNDDIRAGRVPESQAADQKDRNVINRALGVEAEVDVEISSVQVRDGARFLLCSDGIYRHLADEEIAQVLAQNKDPQRAADELKRMVYERGADDNLTAVVIQVGRARQSRVLAVADPTPAVRDEKTVSAKAQAAAGAVDRASGQARGGRIQVEFGGAASRQSSERASERAARDYQEDRSPRAPMQMAAHGASNSTARKIAWALGVLLLMAGAFYLGLRASEWRGDRASDPGATNNVSSPFVLGIDAINRGDYQAAATHFSSIIEREPENGQAHYWLGRVQLEQGEFLKAGASFEKAGAFPVGNQVSPGFGLPPIQDAYVQAAAAYEAAGDRQKALRMLSLYDEARRRRGVPVITNSNSSAR